MDLIPNATVSQIQLHDTAEQRTFITYLDTQPTFILNDQQQDPYEVM